MCLQNLKFVALPTPEIIGVAYSKNCAVLGYAHAPFSFKFFMGLCSDEPCACRIYWPNLQSDPEIIAVAVSG